MSDFFVNVNYINYLYYITYNTYTYYFIYKGCLFYIILFTKDDKFARFLFEYHSGRFETLDLPIIPDDRSQFDVHGALEDDKVKQLEYI